MKFIATCIKLISFLLILTIPLNAQGFSKAGTTGAQFLKIPVGAKAVSMASTFTSIADDPSGLYWNPAGAALFDRFEAGFCYTQWIADIDHNYIGMVVPFGESGTLGLSVIQLSSGQIENTTIAKPKGTGTYYDAQDLAISLTYAKYLVEQVSVGISIKYVNQRIWNTSAQTVAFDLGVLLHTGFYGMNVGLSFQNFGPGLTLSGSDLIKPYDIDPNSVTNPLIDASLKTQPYNLPTSYRASVSMPIIGGDNAPFNLYESSFLIAVDAVHLSDNPEHYSLGAEYGFFDAFFVRGGFIFNTDEEGLTLGCGIKVPLGVTALKFDYGYASFGVFDAVHNFSLGVRI